MLIFALIATTILLGLLALVFAGITLLFAYFLAKEPMRSRKLVLALSDSDFRSLTDGYCRFPCL